MRIMTSRHATTIHVAGEGARALDAAPPTHEIDTANEPIDAEAETRAKPQMRVAVYDSKLYDREYLGRASEGSDVSLQYHDFRLSAGTASTAKGSHAVCIFVNDRVDRACLMALSALGVRLVALRCAGFNNVDRDAAGELGITVVRVPAYSPHAVAEHAVALLLALNRKLHRAYNRVREQNFSLHGLVGFDLYGKTIGIMGTGRIGRVAAQIFRGFGCRVIAYDPMPMPEWASENGIAYTDATTLLAQSDVVSLHLPLTPDTHHLLNATTLALLKPGAYLINTSRGKLVDTSAVIQALKSGRLGGVALDVYEEEEGVFLEDLSDEVLQDDELARLMAFHNVLITAHQGFLTHEALSEIARVTLESVCRFRDGVLPVPDRVVV
jgi:D-lactate dehydrogenase